MFPLALRSLLLVLLPLAWGQSCRADDASADIAAAQVIAVTGSAVFATDVNTLMRYGGEHQLDRPDIQLQNGQWLRAAQAVMARERSSLRLRWNDGREAQLGPVATPIYSTVAMLRERADAAAATPSQQAPIVRDRATPLSAFERAHRPLLLFAFGTLLALLPLLWKRQYRPGFGARLVAGALFAGLVLPVSLLIVAGSTLGRITWYQPPVRGIAFDGAAAVLARLANIGAFALMIGGLVALWVLSLAFISGGVQRLDRRSAFWWWLAIAAVACATLSYAAPYLPNLDLDSQWQHFWLGWAKYYSRGAWLLLPLAQLLACAGSATAPRRPRRQDFAASGAAMAFVACYALGVAQDDEPYLAGPLADVATRVTARKAICSADHVFEGLPENFRIVAEADCTPTPARAPGDFSGLLQRCEAAVVDVRIDTVLRSAQLAPGQTVEFRVDHARLDVADLQRALSRARLRFLAREKHIDGHVTYVRADRMARGYTTTDGEAGADYARGLLAECPR